MRITYLLIIATFLLLTSSHSISITQESEVVRFPRLSAEIDPNETYIHELLLLALENSGTQYRLVPTEGKMQQARSIYEMTTPHGNVDLIWSMGTDERETQMIAIKIPIDKGLIGWRIPLVKEENAKLFANVKNLQDLKAYTAGQEHDWPDTPILRENGVRVITSTSYEPLFNMLQGGRFDYFPRSMFEIWNEFAAHPKHRLHIDPYIILHYPAAYYFFVTTRRPKLANDLRLGLELAIKDGSFERLFQKHNQISISKADIKHRTVIEMRNPLIQNNKAFKSGPEYRPELWFQP
jgi:hypothetical protein